MTNKNAALSLRDWIANMGRPFTHEEDARLIEVRLSAPGYATLVKAGEELGRRPSTLKNRLNLLAANDDALREKLTRLGRQPRISPRPVDPIIARLRSVREERGIWRDELADRVGYSLSAIERWENGRGDPPAQALLDWAQAPGVEIVAQEAGK